MAFCLDGVELSYMRRPIVLHVKAFRCFETNLRLRVPVPYFPNCVLIVGFIERFSNGKYLHNGMVR